MSFPLNTGKKLITVSQLQRLNKERGEALLLMGRQYPYITHMADISDYHLPPMPPMPFPVLPNSKISKRTLEELLEKYFLVIDPTSVNRQGEDEGIQYRTGIYYTDPGDGAVAAEALAALARRVGKPLAVENLPLKNFYPAEEYHQKYLEKHPEGYCHTHFDP